MLSVAALLLSYGRDASYLSSMSILLLAAAKQMKASLTKLNSSSVICKIQHMHFQGPWWKHVSTCGRLNKR